MSMICPKCRHVREADATVPDWQCPACGVAYAKVNTDPGPSKSMRIYAKTDSRSGLPWGRLLLIAALGFGAWIGIKAVNNRYGGFSGMGASLAGGYSPDELRALAGNVKDGDVLIYTTTACPYGAAAKGWMRENGFNFTECDAEADPRCSRELQALGADGVPYLLVRGHHMKDGFNSDEFLAALKR